MPRLILIALAVLAMLVPLASAGAAQLPTEEGQLCLGCHGTEGLTKRLGNGQEISLHVKSGQYLGSVHGKMDCSSCHAGYPIEAHPQNKFKSIRDFKVKASEACSNCHSFDKGIHKTMLKNTEKLVCADCHDAHNIQRAGQSENCKGCHKYGMNMATSGDQMHTAIVDIEGLSGSTHKDLRCTDCHFGFSYKEHPERVFKSSRDLSVANSDLCRRCHFDKYTKTLEGIHYEMLSKGRMEAPVCVDCHGSHGILSGRKEKILSARRCEKCHSEIYYTYTKSIHGNALLSEHNNDVPVCSDCHKAHDITDPRTTAFQNKTPELCGNCHSNKELMARYGLSTNVVQSYLQDFHGVTVKFYNKSGNGEATRNIAVCTDCHGIHDITSTKSPDANTLKANLVKRCRTCHPGASDNFPDGWLSHYEPSLKNAPLVYAVNLTYKIFIPFMIIGLVLQILLHIWRYAVNR